MWLVGAELFSFIFRTVREAANDPSNKRYWLPVVLGGVDSPEGGGKLLPLHADSWSLGKVTGEGGATFRDAIKTQWWTATGVLWRHAQDPRYQDLSQHQAIACPDDPWPSFSLSSATVYGLDNVYLMDKPTINVSAGGYATVLTLAFGHYSGLSGLVPVQIEGDYRVAQCVCSAAPTGSICDGFIPHTAVSGGGHFKVTLTDFWVDAQASIALHGSGPARTLQVTVNRLEAHGSGDAASPQVQVDQLGIDTELQGFKGAWLTAADDALTSAQGRAALTANLNATLNQPGFLQSLSDTLTHEFARLLDGNLGSVPAGGLPAYPAAPGENPVDGYIFDRLRAALNDPVSDYYLPQLVCGNADPPLDPLVVGTVDLGPQGTADIQFSDVTLEQVALAGLANIQAPPDQMTTAPPGLRATLVAGGLNPPPTVTVVRGGAPTRVTVAAPPLRLSGQFTCLLGQGEQPLAGAFTCQVRSAQVAVALAASGAQLEDLVVRFTEVILRVALTDLQIDVVIDSVFKDIVNGIFNTDRFKQQALDAVNAQLAAHLDVLGRAATDAAKRQIATRLGT